MPDHPSDPLTTLSTLPLFTGLELAEVQAILDQGRSRKVPGGSFFFFQDDPARHLYALISGRAKIFQSAPNGQQVILNMAGPGSLLGLVAFTQQGTYPAFAQAVSDSQALSWDHAHLVQLTCQFPTLALNGMALLAERIHEFQDRIRELATERVERRLARLLLRLVRQVGRKTEEGVLIDWSVSRQDLAEMSGTTLYTVSRTLSQWDRQGLIASGRERVLIRNPHGLVSIAEDLPPGEE